jgi:putative membrane protein
MTTWAWWGWLMMSIGILVFWGLIAWGAALLLRGRGPAATAQRPSPEKILDERLARGEIDIREYRERLEALRGRRAVRA